MPTRKLKQKGKDTAWPTCEVFRCSLSKPAPFVHSSFHGALLSPTSLVQHASGGDMSSESSLTHSLRLCKYIDNTYFGTDSIQIGPTSELPRIGGPNNPSRNPRC